MPYIRSVVLREFLAEFLGVLVLCVIGNGSIAQQVLSRKNDFLSINIAYGVAVTFGVYVAFGVSGGHINPAVTVSQAVIGKFPWYKVPIFLGAQYLGGFVSAIIVFLIYLDGINHIDSGVRQVGGENGTAGIFATYPQPYVSNVTAFFDQVLGTAILMVGVLALTNEKNVSLRVKSLEPLVIGFLVAAIGMSYGVNCGAFSDTLAVNNTLGILQIHVAPRIFTAIAGYGGEVFYANHWYFWVPVLGPHVGAVVGTLVYKFLVGMHFAHDLELLAGAEGGDDEAARVGKGKADDAVIGDGESGRGSPDNAAAVRRAMSRQATMAPHHIIGHQNTMWRQNTVARQMSYAPSTTSQVSQRKVMWRQNTARLSPRVSGIDNIEFMDLPEAMPPTASIRDRVLFSAISDSKRPGI